MRCMAKWNTIDCFEDLVIIWVARFALICVSYCPEDHGPWPKMIS